MLLLKYHDTLQELHWKSVSSCIGSHLPQIISHISLSPLSSVSGPENIFYRREWVH